MKVLAIDPSINHLWFAVVEDWALLVCYTIHSKSEGDARVLELGREVGALVKVFQPDAFAIETQYFWRMMSNSVLKTCEVKGACKMAAYLQNPSLVFKDITPSQAKAAMGIARVKRAEAKKLAVQFVREKFSYVKKIDDNAADAVGIALAAWLL